MYQRECNNDPLYFDIAINEYNERDHVRIARWTQLKVYVWPFGTDQNLCTYRFEQNS